MKHVSIRGPYLSSRNAANSASPLSIYKSCSSLHLWSDARIFILVLSLAQSSSLFLHCISQPVFLFLLFDEGNDGTHVVVCSMPLFTVWAKAWKYLSRWEGHCPVCAAWVRGAASSVYMRIIDTSQTLPLALIGCIDSGAVDPCKSNDSHWVVPQTVDFYTADLYLSWSVRS